MTEGGLFKAFFELAFTFMTDVAHEYRLSDKQNFTNPEVLNKTQMKYEEEYYARYNYTYVPWSYRDYHIYHVWNMYFKYGTLIKP